MSAKQAKYHDKNRSSLQRLRTVLPKIRRHSANNTNIYIPTPYKQQPCKTHLHGTYQKKRAVAAKFTSDRSKNCKRSQWNLQAVALRAFFYRPLKRY